MKTYMDKQLGKPSVYITVNEKKEVTASWYSRDEEKHYFDVKFEGQTAQQVRKYFRSLGYKIA